MEKKYLDFKFEIKNIIEDDPDNFVFIGYASTFGNVDRGDDTILRGAFTESLTEMTPKLLWQHDHSEPLGIFTEIFEDDIGLYVKGKMPKTDSFVRDRVMPQMKIGSINSMSIGFNIIKDEVDRETDIRTIVKVKLWEISLVSIPMDPKALIIEAKSLFPFQDLPFAKNEDGNIILDMSWNASDAIKRIESANGGSVPNSKAFLWHDKKDINDSSSYKLPIADIVSGQVVAIPKAIFAAAAALRGARGGVDIPENEREQVIKNVNKYYAKMALPSPFEKSFSPFIDEMSHISEVSDFMKSWGFSNSETNSITSAFKRISRNETVLRNEDTAMEELSKSLLELNKTTKEKFNV